MKCEVPCTSPKSHLQRKVPRFLFNTSITIEACIVSLSIFVDERRQHILVVFTLFIVMKHVIIVLLAFQPSF